MLAFSRYRKQLVSWLADFKPFLENTTPWANNEHLFPLQRSNRVYWGLLPEKSVDRKAKRHRPFEHLHPLYSEDSPQENTL